MKNEYENPLITRYASPETSRIFSDDNRFSLWRKLWIALAESESELGLPVTAEQIAEMKKYAADINYEVAAAREREVRHDVMAHVYAFGRQAKSAAPIIHLGATSCFVTDNAEIVMINDALKVVRAKLLNVMDRLAKFALKYKTVPVLGFTHLQPAQLTTLGKRASLWLQDLLLDYENLEFLLSRVALRGVKGTTGTQGSFLSLFGGDSEKVKRLERLVENKMGFNKSYAVTGQTYPRKFDYNVLSALSQIAQSASKFATDLRLLQSMKEVEEPFESSQIGSSAMAYKRNPMRSERICSLARFVMSLPQTAAVTAGSQWLERTLDDSAAKRITIPQAFLAVDGILNLYMNVSENLVVYEKIIAKHIAAELPFMATEVIIAECVKAGGNRQDVHERIRVHSMAAARVVKERGGENDLIARLKADPAFSSVAKKLDAVLKPENFTGRAAEQTDEFIADFVAPLLARHKALLTKTPDITV
ncbi:MAG: adenylosuccinate lyase [Clostridiales bacterium]|jgi:adenylosuccinate lyase|nr:adenylosuccinate lyase [Clostridiales bacterium]